MRVDAHHHFWDPARADYPWMTAALTPIRRAFGPADLQPHLAAAEIAATILVQTRASLDETREFLALAEGSPFVAGVVGWVDLTGERVERDIASLRAGPGGNKLVGLRHQVHDEADPQWLRRADVGRGLQAVAEADLTFDLLVRERELPATVAVAERLPALRLVLDHFAKPPIASGALPAGWCEGINRLGALPNVTCKLSGLVTEADWQRWTIADLRPYAAHVWRAFGARRLIFGSDWPVCLLAAPYDRVVHVAGTLVREFAPDDTADEAVFGGTAAGIYRLGR